MRANTPDVFWKRVDKSGGASACWPWTGRKKAFGYGCFYMSQKFWTASRFAWTMERGPIPPGKFVLHRCDNPPCCNPAHLYIGTKADNSHDAVNRGRHRNGCAFIRRARHPMAKLTEDQVAEIRAMRGKVLQQVLADKFGVTRSNICVIQRGRSWLADGVVIRNRRNKPIPQNQGKA